jgi:hypothetical protein
MFELEQEYLRRHPKRTWQGSGGAATDESQAAVLRKALRGILVQLEALVDGPAVEHSDAGVVGEPALEVLQRISESPGGRMNKLEVHQLAREVGIDRATLARMYNGDPPLLRTDGPDRVITDAGRARLAGTPQE